MSLKPFWVKHPILLRLTAGLMLLGAPLLLLYSVVMAAWDEREEIADMYRQVWRYMIRGNNE